MSTKTIGQFFLPAMVMVGMATSLARASNITDVPCPTATLGEYMSRFGGVNGCGLGSLTFFNFFSAQFVSPNLDTAALSNILVVPDAASEMLNFENFNTVVPVTNTTQLFTIDFTIDPGPILVGQTLSIDPPVGVAVTQYYCGNGFFNTGLYVTGITPHCGGAFLLTNTVTPANPTNTVLFPFPVSLVDLQTVIKIDPNGHLDNMSMDTLVSSSVPEPATLGVSGCVLLAGLALRRRRSRSGARAAV